MTLPRFSVINFTRPNQAMTFYTLLGNKFNTTKTRYDCVTLSSNEFNTTESRRDLATPSSNWFNTTKSSRDLATLLINRINTTRSSRDLATNSNKIFNKTKSSHCLPHSTDQSENSPLPQPMALNTIGYPFLLTLQRPQLQNIKRWSGRISVTLGPPAEGTTTP